MSLRSGQARWRRTSGYGPVVLEDRQRQALVGLEPGKTRVSIGRAVTLRLADHKEALGNRFASGVVLYDGEAGASFGEGFFAVPIRAFLETR